MCYTYLALGDSYTIGEQVQLSQSFPYQTIQKLRMVSPEGKFFAAPEIVAQTGWTTDELNAVIEQTTFLEKYDLVSLLIGVNNQYRGRSVEEFSKEFLILLQKAIAFAGNNPKHVFVLSIPDWGVTPFAEGKNREMIATEIDACNKVCKSTAERYLCNYIETITSQRADGNKMEFLAADGLHPSGKEYEKWAQKIAAAIAVNNRLKII
jgi:lysophospholipase L1-like esterase